MTQTQQEDTETPHSIYTRSRKSTGRVFHHTTGAYLRERTDRKINPEVRMQKSLTTHVPYRKRATLKVGGYERARSFTSDDQRHTCVRCTTFDLRQSSCFYRLGVRTHNTNTVGQSHTGTKYREKLWCRHWSQPPLGAQMKLQSSADRSAHTNPNLFSTHSSRE